MKVFVARVQLKNAYVAKLLLCYGDYNEPDPTIRNQSAKDTMKQTGRNMQQSMVKSL